MNCKFFNIFRSFSFCLFIICHVCIICIRYCNPTILLSFQNLFCRLDIALICIYNHMIGPSRNPNIIPTFICGICIHLFPRPCFKCIIAIIIPCPHAWSLPVFRHLHIHCFFRIRCFICFDCLWYHCNQQYCHEAKGCNSFYHFTHKFSSYTSSLTVVFQNNLRALCLIS